MNIVEIKQDFFSLIVRPTFLNFHITDAYASENMNIQLDIQNAGTELVFSVCRTKNITLNLVINLLDSSAIFNGIGIYALQNAQLNFNFLQTHHIDQTQGSLWLHGIAFQEAQVNFQGKIVIQPRAIASSGSMIHKTLVCSHKACIKTVPNLEIKTHNVSCKHAATIQQFHDDEMFYLQSKGITSNNARILVMKSFLESNIKHIKHDLNKSSFKNMCEYALGFY